MKAKFLALFLSLFATAALATDATVTWVLPTQNTDGTSIPATGPGSIVSTKIEHGYCSGSAFGTKLGEQTVNAPATTATIVNLAAGFTYCFRASARNTFGVDSAFSNVAQKVVPNPTPNAPVLSATITLAYDLKGISRDGTILLGRAVGTVELGTPCIDYAYQTNKGTYHMVDPANVKLTRASRSPAIVTKCAIG